MFNYIGWHIELTRRCPLACPACVRTWDKSSVVDPKQDINTKDVLNFFPKQRLQQTKYICLQGNLGDPIYHPDFHKISNHFFDADDLAVITNGMHTKDFWQEVLNTWPSNSRITLSIDGLQDTNHIYRVNSRWEKIEELFNIISTTKRNCKIEWKFIVFEHNYKQVEKAEMLSKKVGIDIFRIQKTRKLPDDSVVKEYTNDKWFANLETIYEDSLSPFCETGDMHYIDAFGKYYPCCWWADNNKEQGFWTPINIKDNDITNFENYFNSFNNYLTDYKKCPSVCKKFCRTIKNNKLDMQVPNTQINRSVEKYD